MNAESTEQVIDRLEAEARMLDHLPESQRRTALALLRDGKPVFHAVDPNWELLFAARVKSTGEVRYYIANCRREFERCYLTNEQLEVLHPVVPVPPWDPKRELYSAKAERVGKLLLGLTELNVQDVNVETVCPSL